jgi:hypothetical protein
MSLWSRDEVPHIFARTSRLRPGEFLVTCAKRLLQQNLKVKRTAMLRCGKPLLTPSRHKPV